MRTKQTDRPFHPEGTAKTKTPPQRILRLLDANLNRTREGFRVLEDTARFVWNDADCFRRFRAERHRLDLMTRRFYPELIRSRDIHQDEGRKIKEGRRAGVQDVAAANFRRCEESLRVLEEYAKVFADQAADAFKKMRFRIYDWEKTMSNGRSNRDIHYGKNKSR